jgi:hypothetical protein
MVRQRVCLERDPKSCDSSTTWRTSRFGSTGTRKLDVLGEDIRAMAREVAAAWRAANPKP